MRYAIHSVFGVFLLCPVIISATAYISNPVVTMREEPSDGSRVASQAIMSDVILVGKQENGWSLIETSDGYTGWVPSGSFVQRETPYETSLVVSSLVAHVYSVEDTEWGPIATLSYGTKLKALDTSKPRWFKVSLPNDQVCFIQKGNVLPEEVCHTPKDLVSFSMKFLNLPYTWGGKSGFGYDCSGFIQMLYGHIGIGLQRDSKQQINDSRFVDVSVEQVVPGDLVFFGRSEQKINHVGMCIGEGRFIHAAPAPTECKPWIHVSELNDTPWNGTTENLPFRRFRHFVGTH